jgi:hypothetical protein
VQVLQSWRELVHPPALTRWHRAVVGAVASNSQTAAVRPTIAGGYPELAISSRCSLHLLEERPPFLLLRGFRTIPKQVLVLAEVPRASVTLTITHLESAYQEPVMIPVIAHEGWLDVDGVSPRLSDDIAIVESYFTQGLWNLLDMVDIIDPYNLASLGVGNMNLSPEQWVEPVVSKP